MLKWTKMDVDSQKWNRKETKMDGTRCYPIHFLALQKTNEADACKYDSAISRLATVLPLGIRYVAPIPVTVHTRKTLVAIIAL
ncbi:hypothetical protein J6590_093005 [Homalodisca vitripennis]|nr:hypothetical protein J6590_093005 [Homalodisca vitripennis]